MTQRKLPAWQFYVGDWRKDPGVQALDYHDRGVLFEILCMMFESEDRGVLLLNGRPMPEAALARLLGLPLDQPADQSFEPLTLPLRVEPTRPLRQTLATLLEYGVLSTDEESGALYSRRMVRDEEKRRQASEFGKMGGNPQLSPSGEGQTLKGRVKGRDKAQLKGRDKAKGGSSSSSSEHSSAGANAPAGGQLSLVEGGAFEEAPAAEGDPSLQTLKAAKTALRSALEERIGTIPNPAAQNDAIKWLLEKGRFTVEQCIACLDWQLANWSKGSPSWLTVRTHIGAWLAQQKAAPAREERKTAADHNKGGTGRVVV